MRDMKVAAVQMVSGPEVGANLLAAKRLVENAAAQGAELVLLPEYFGTLGASLAMRQAAHEQDGDGPQQTFLSDLARAHRIFLVGGCVPISISKHHPAESDVPAQAQNRARSACLVYGPEGQRLARYDKMHLFRFSRNGEHYDETQMIEAGTQAVSFDAPCGRVGLSICYDLRFPELYRALGDVALMLVPAAFTEVTGKAHWEILLRARAIENQCYVLAAAQGGVHPNGRQTHGHSMLIDPWGEVVARLDQGEGVVVGTLDLARMAEVRTQLPALQHRRVK